MHPRILVRRPSPRLAEGELTHIDRQPVDADLALEQWKGYVGAFGDHGWDVVEIAAADEHPDGVFVEDTVVMFDGSGRAHLTRSAVSRRGELASTAAAVDQLARGPGLEVARISRAGASRRRRRAQGRRRTVYVGQPAGPIATASPSSARCSSRASWHVVPVAVSKVLHLKSGVTALPDGTVVGHRPLVDDPTVFPRFLPVPEEHGTAVVDLGNGGLLMSADAPRTAELFAGADSRS